MPFTKGDKNINRRGRPKGSTNRSSEMMKVNVARAANLGLDYLKEDYERLRKEDPRGALNLLMKLLEYNIPKLKSVDMNLEAEVNQKIEEIVVNINRSGSKDENRD